MPDLSLFSKSVDDYKHYIETYLSLLANATTSNSDLAFSYLTAGSWGLMARGIESLPAIKHYLENDDPLLRQTLGFVAREIARPSEFPTNFANLYCTSQEFRREAESAKVIEGFPSRTRTRISKLIIEHGK